MSPNYLRQEIQIKWPAWPVAPAISSVVDYDLRLRESGADYIAEKAISYYLKPGEVEGIGVHIYCEKSSVHEFMASVRVKGQWITAQDNFKLHYYRPQHAEWGVWD